MAEYPRNALMEQPIDPQFYRFQGSNALMGPIVTPDSRAGRTPDSYGGMGNQAPRPAPWEINSGLAESLSPMVQGYGAGQMASYARDALGSGDYGTATGAGLMAAMSMMPMKKGAAPVAAAERPTGIRAYHGSPHDFEKFDISKIGTGEGAQAYGHGLYFAEHEDVAKGYRDTLAKSLINIDGVRKPVGDLMAHEETAANRIMQAGSAEKAKTLPGVDALAQRDIDNLVQRGFSADPGRMYEVNIKADPEHFLDWDKPLSQQSEKVRQAIEKGVGENANDPTFRRMFLDSGKGESLLGALAGEKYDKRAATQKLQEAGIPGIRYLDQGSRGAGEGSRNYVVFDPATIEIMRKYGLMGPMAGGVGMNALYGNNDQ